MKPGVLKLRKPIPLARSIRWVPAATAEPPRAIDDPALFITQGALRELMRHVRSAPEQELLGFLLGELFECPETGVSYAVVNGVLRTGYAIPEVEPVQIPDEQWLAAQVEVRRRRTWLVGWYHSAPFVGPRPSRLDLDTHRARFPEPWQVGLVVTGAFARAEGGVFRVLPSRPGSSELDGAFVPFHELLDDDALLADGRKRTIIDWAGYRTPDPVVRDASQLRAGASRAAGAARDATLPAAELRAAAAERGVGPGPGAAGAVGPVPVLIPPPPTEPAEEAEAPARAGAGRRIWVGAGAVVVAGALVAAALWSQRERIERLALAATDAPAARPARASAVRSGTPAETTTTPASGALAPSGPPGAPTRAQPAPAAPAPVTAPNAAVARFDSLAGSLEQATRNFHDRSADFAVGRIGCSGLARGYRAADDAYIALATSYREVARDLDSTREARYESLEREIQAVNEEFDRTRCPRP